MKQTLALGLVTLSIAASQAQTAFNGNYGQTFNTLPTNAAPWANNTTIPGWFLYTDSTNASTTPAVLPLPSFGAPVANERGAFSLTDRAISLGTGGQRGVPTPMIVLALTNATPLPVSQLLIEYTGEQYGFNTGSGGGLSFSYGVGNVDPFTGSFTGVPTLSFAGLNSAANPNIPGGYAEVAVSDTLTLNSALQPGQTIWLRWTAVGGAFSGAVSAVDGLAINAINIPEPASAVALLAGFAGALGTRRRKR